MDGTGNIKKNTTLNVLQVGETSVLNKPVQ